MHNYGFSRTCHKQYDMQEIAWFALSDQFDLRREILHVRPPHQLLEILLFHVGEQMQLTNVGIMGFGHEISLNYRN